MQHRRGSPTRGLGQATSPIWIFSSDISSITHAIYCLLVGISFALFCVTTHVLWKRPTRRPSTWIFYLTSSISLFIIQYICLAFISTRTQSFNLSLCNFAMNALYEANRIPALAPCSTIFEPPNYRAVGIITLPVYVFQTALIVFSDSVVTYRAFVLNGNKAIRSILVILWIVLLLTGVITSIFYEAPASPGHNVFKENISIITMANSYLSFAFICWSLTCNVFATGAVGVLLWSHRKRLRAVWKVKNGRLSSTLRILAVLVESGMLYCAFQALQIALVYYASTDSTSASFSLLLIQTVNFGLSGIYPSLVFYICNAQALSSDRCVVGIDDTIGQSNDRSWPYPTVMSEAERST